MVAFGRDQDFGSDDRDFARLSIARLRERAAQCTQRALEAHSEDIAAELKLLARDYERDALRLETELPRVRRAASGNGG